MYSVFLMITFWYIFPANQHFNNAELLYVVRANEYDFD